MRPLDLSDRVRLADAVLVVGAMLAGGLLWGSTGAEGKERGQATAIAAQVIGRSPHARPAPAAPRPRRPVAE